MIINKITTLDSKEFLQIQNDYVDHLKEYFIHYLDGQEIQEEQDYLSHFKEVYDFPSYYGNNFNAFIDCMRDLDARDEQGFILVIHNYSKFLKNYPKEKEMFTVALKDIMFYLEKECLTTSGGRNHLKSFDVYLVEDSLNDYCFEDIHMS